MYTVESLSTAVNEEQAPTRSMTAKITTYLRWVGSILIVLSAISFMLEGLDEFLPSYRYWVGLGLTLLLCAGGLICAYVFHETKGARIFFGLGAAFLPVQVSQVSAMIYAYWQGRSALQPEYAWLQFMEVSPSVIVVDFIITALLLVLVSYASYSILARQYVKTLLLVSIVGNTLLMLPVRDANWVPLMMAILFIFIRKYEQKLHNDRQMRLAEGIAARVLMSLPLWIIVGRSLLHPASYLLVMVFSIIIMMYCIYDIKRYTQSEWLVYLAQVVGTFSAIYAWICALLELGVIANHYVVLLPIAVILFVLSFQVSYYARFYRFSSAVFTVGICFLMMSNEQLMAPIISILGGIVLTISGIKCREKAPFIIGNLCTMGGFIFYWDYAINFYTSAPWVSSIALGLLVILLASYLENKEKQIIEKSRYYFSELKSWH